MSFHGGFLGVLIALALFARQPAQALARGHRFRRAPVSARARRGAAGQLHQWRAVGPTFPPCPGRWCFRRSTPCRATRRSSTSSASKGSCCSRWSGSTRGAVGRSGAVSGLFLIGYGMLSLPGRICARTRRLPRDSCARVDDGAVAVAADDRRRHRTDGRGPTGAPASRNPRYSVPNRSGGNRP